MIVKFHAIGYMRTHLKEDHYLIELESDFSTLADFYDEIGRTIGEKLSNSVWDHRKRRFRGPIILKVDDEVVRQENYNLKDGQNIEISRMLIGG